MSDKDITEPIKSMLKKEYDRGYQQAENDYYNQSEKDRQSSYDCGYQQGRADAIDDCVQIVQKIKYDYNTSEYDKKIPINYGTICGIIIKLEQLKERKE